MSVKIRGVIPALGPEKQLEVRERVEEYLREVNLFFRPDEDIQIVQIVMNIAVDDGIPVTAIIKLDGVPEVVFE